MNKEGKRVIIFKFYSKDTLVYYKPIINGYLMELEPLYSHIVSRHGEDIWSFLGIDAYIGKILKRITRELNKLPENFNHRTIKIKI